MKTKKYNLNITICLILFFIISLISIYSARTISNMGNIFIKQLIFYIIGLLILLLSYRYKDIIIKYRYLWYIGLNILLLFLLFFGISVNGSKCWIFLGPVSFQPSEFMKLSLIIIIASLLSNTKKNMNMKDEFKLLLKIGLITFVPSILTFLEPDTGVVIIYLIIMIVMVISHGINKKWYLLVSILLALLASSVSILYFVDNDLLMKLLGDNIFYRMDRILNWSNQNGYQLENSLVAIGSSGLTGFGFNNTPLYFPESSTDFIFTTFSSNFGFMGSIVLILGIIIFDVTILNMCKQKINKQDKYILIGICAMIFYQQIQNISMTIGLLPITGITLPFISYGGSSLLSYMFIMGILIRIMVDEKRYIN